MTLFRYEAMAADGSVEQDTTEADTREDAARQLLRRGLRPYRLESAAGSQASTGRSARKARNKIAAGRFFSALHVLLQAGLTIDAALRVAGSNESRKRDRELFADVHSAMTAGQPFSKALSERVDLPRSVTAILVAGESSARMAQTIGSIVEIYAERSRRKSELVSAILYPSILLFVMFAALGVVTFVLVPAIEPIFEGAGRPMPVFVQILALVRSTVLEHDLTVAILALCASAGAYLSARSERGRGYFSAALLRLPLIGRLLKQRGTAAYLKILALLLGNGVRLNTALELAADATTIEADRKALKGLRDAVYAGRSLYQAAEEASVLDALTLSFVKVGEEANSLPDALNRASALLDAQAKQTADRLTTLLTPAITIVTGLAVGGIVVSVMDTLLSINELALQ